MIKELMDFFTMSDTWAFRSMRDPAIKAAEATFAAVVEKIKPRLSEDEYTELLDAVSETTAAYAEAGTLYGLYIASQIQGLIANPYDRHN